MEDKPQPLEILRAAFLSLQQSHPEMVTRLSVAMTPSDGGDSSLPDVAAAFREAARALVPTDKDAAETLFTLAEVLAQTAARGT